MLSKKFYMLASTPVGGQTPRRLRLILAISGGFPTTQGIFHGSRDPDLTAEAPGFQLK